MTSATPPPTGPTDGPAHALSGASVDLEPTTLVDAVAPTPGPGPTPRPSSRGTSPPPETYAELWDHAARLAAALGDAGVGQGDQVAIWATRSMPVVAAALAAMALVAFTCRSTPPTRRPGSPHPRGGPAQGDGLRRRRGPGR